MVIVVNKETTKEQIESALGRLEHNKSKSKLINFFGKLKGHFGEGVQYQTDIRKDWDK